MTDEFKTKQESLDYRLRSWLVRRISGKHKTENLLYRRDEAILHSIVETLHKEISKQVGEMLTASIAKAPKDLLAQFIAANKHLSDLQKSQIASIFDAPSIDNSRAYLQ